MCAYMYICVQVNMYRDINILIPYVNVHTYMYIHIDIRLCVHGVLCFCVSLSVPVRVCGGQ